MTSSLNYALYIIIIFVIWSWWICFSHPIYKIQSYGDIADKCKTGDIILFHALDNINPIFIGTYYGHIGVVYRESATAEPQIFEAFNPRTMPMFPREFAKGIALAPLKQRLNSYRGYCFYKELRAPVSAFANATFPDLIQYAKENMFYECNVIMSGAKKLFLNEVLTNGTNCGELVYISLIRLGILPSEYFTQNNCHHLLYLANNTKEYYEPVYILSNYFAEP